MIRWNKWTRDYTYTYEWHDGMWKLIHKKSNRPIVHWVKSWYNTLCVGSRTYKKGLPSQTGEVERRGISNYEAR